MSCWLLWLPLVGVVAAIGRFLCYAHYSCSWFAIAEILLGAAICSLMFSLIASAIGDLLDFVLDL